MPKFKEGQRVKATKNLCKWRHQVRHTHVWPKKGAKGTVRKSGHPSDEKESTYNVHFDGEPSNAYYWVSEDDLEAI